MDYDDILAIATPEGVELHLTLAGPASRFVSATVDILIQIVLLIALGIVLGVTGSAGLGGGGVAVLLWFVLSFAVITFYDVFFEVFNSGRTPGKLLNGLRVVRIEGQPVGFVTSVIRNVIRPLDFMPSAYLLGAVVILATKKNQRIGDVVAGTLVVRELGGGRRRRHAPLPAMIPVASPPQADGLLHWDTSRITQEELATVRDFLARRQSIAPAVRGDLARTLAERLRPKLVGAPSELRGEQFLLALVRAKAGRPG
jgi:uncharacterized RDD family membrane protein YckC